MQPSLNYFCYGMDPLIHIPLDNLNKLDFGGILTSLFGQFPI